MNQPYNGGAAFPAPMTWRNDSKPMTPAELCATANGMSLRDYFAASTLAHIPALLAANDKNKSLEQIAGWAYQVADAMLLARLKPSGLEEKVSEP